MAEECGMHLSENWLQAGAFSPDMVSGCSAWSGTEERNVEICWSETLRQQWRPLWRYERERERTFEWNSQPWVPPQATVSILHSTFCLVRQRFAGGAVVRTLGCTTLTADWKTNAGVVDLSGKIMRKIMMQDRSSSRFTCWTFGIHRDWFLMGVFHVP